MREKVRMECDGAYDRVNERVRRGIAIREKHRGKECGRERKREIKKALTEEKEIYCLTV